MECIIRSWRLEDADALAGILNNKKIQDNLRDGIPFPYKVEDAKEFIKTVLHAPEDSKYVFAIIIEDQPVGSIGVFRQDNIHSRTAELGYYVAKSHWGKGIGTSAVKQVCNYIFESTDIIRIFAEPFAYNRGSCRILEKAGFQLEGTLRKNAVKNGIVIDMNMYSKIKA